MPEKGSRIGGWIWSCGEEVGGLGWSWWLWEWTEKEVLVPFCCQSAPPYGMESRQALQNLLPIGTKVSIRTKTVERYGRRVAGVLKGSTNLLQTLVRTRDAFVFWQHISGCDRRTYSHLKHDARLKGAGGV